jgi:hypothetical protein
MAIIALFGRPAGLNWVAIGGIASQMSIEAMLEPIEQIFELLPTQREIFVVRRIEKEPILMVGLYQHAEALGPSRPYTFVGAAIFIENMGISGLEVHHLLVNLLDQIRQLCIRDGRFISTISDDKKNFIVPKISLETLASLSSPIPTDVIEASGNVIVLDMEANAATPLPAMLFATALDAAMDLAVFQGKRVVIGSHSDLVLAAKHDSTCSIESFCKYLKQCVTNDDENRKFRDEVTSKLSYIGHGLKDLHFSQKEIAVKLIEKLSNSKVEYTKEIEMQRYIIVEEISSLNSMLKEMTNFMKLLGERGSNAEKLLSMLSLKLANIDDLKKSLHSTSGAFYEMGKFLQVDLFERIGNLQIHVEKTAQNLHSTREAELLGRGLHQISEVNNKISSDIDNMRKEIQLSSSLTKSNYYDILKKLDRLAMGAQELLESVASKSEVRLPLKEAVVSPPIKPIFSHENESRNTNSAEVITNSRTRVVPMGAEPLVKKRPIGVHPENSGANAPWPEEEQNFWYRNKKIIIVLVVSILVMLFLGALIQLWPPNGMA